MNGRASGNDDATSGAPEAHPFAADERELLDRLAPLMTADDDDADDAASDENGTARGKLETGLLTLMLPSRAGRPVPSDRLVNLLGLVDPTNESTALELKPVQLPAVRVDSARAMSLLLRLESMTGLGIERGYSLRYWTEVARFVLGLLADQRFIPSVTQSESFGATGIWQPWLLDEEVRRLIEALHGAMPPIARAAVDRHEGQPASILNEAITSLADATIREALMKDGYGETLEAIEDEDDPHATWLRGLLGSEHRLDASRIASRTQEREGVELFRDVTQWIARLDESVTRREFSLVLRLNEPDNLPTDDETAALDADSLIWRLSLHLAADDSNGALIDADEIWHHSAATPSARQPMAEHPEEVLLSELTRAGRICELLEPMLSQPTPTGLDLRTDEAHTFLREHRPVLEEAGVRVQTPLWWNRSSSRIGARLQLDTPDDPHSARDGGSSSGARPALGLQTLVDYKWEISLGDQTLTDAEFRCLMEQNSPLIRLRGQWVEFIPEDRKRAKDFLGTQTSGQMTLLEALRQVSGSTDESHGLKITGLDATGWFGELLNATSDNAEHITMLEQPRAFKGTLRPYQKAGLSWLAFLDRFGLGACLADDMGLGKTIQLIALLQHERERSHRPGLSGDTNGRGHGRDDRSDTKQYSEIDADPGQGRDYMPGLNPTLLIVPTSVVSNWRREIVRFAPELRVHVQHGPDRPSGAMFDHAASDADVVITTYALVSRDLETLMRQSWHRIVLDEAQYIKNPPTKQARAIRSIQTPRRVALTGTPVENRLSELWSIMEFCNPEYLGPQGEFRRRFAVPIERHRDPEAARMLRMMMRPFVLRRLKSDPTVIGDLPPCVESKEYATLTPEQASLYQRSVDAMLNEVESSNGIQRRGLILATLVKLKQICNHPLQVAGGEARSAVSPAATDRDLSQPTPHGTLVERSGKCRRLIELLEEVVASEEKALVFTQFRQMGHLLTTMIRAELDCDALFLHGGTPSAKRQQLIDRFQDPHGGVPVFILSLKAGGLGLNLTAANHVFHFDRWWNPAVEKQATDRAFRIGQTRTVQVHKFVCQGTLEERIDEMIEEKTELAENIIGAGEKWLTELSTTQLRDMLMLSQSAMETAE